ncbi:MAG: hypothetical protein AVDCRST_MAG43-2119 [uncultured Thermomicrobiales bacterium]|uniref:Uncharacterized protein n=1 Tax=uncultured Thermomicrobiales bacterium TaxID=1645740 RepID=A0A6J4UXQ4_9BACT|nr:MAG: hypothetical protein AVDCRST_MAG43-2119 [uncultured Thermomicrobiales bacterium]
MIETANRIEVAMISPNAFGIVLMLVIAVVAWVNRPFLRDVATDDDRPWRFLARAGAMFAVLTGFWIGFFDNWLQLLAEPFRLSRRWELERVVIDPVDVEIRIVTGVLLAALLTLGAALFARHIGGYLLQAVLLIVGVATWIPLFIVQQRAEVMVIDGVSASQTLGSFAGIAAFWVLRTALGIAIVVSTLMICMMLIAPIVTLLLDLTRLRHPRITREADAFFSVLQSHAADHQDVPLKDRWRPIRQPS